LPVFCKVCAILARDQIRMMTPDQRHPAAPDLLGVGVARDAEDLVHGDRAQAPQLHGELLEQRALVGRQLVDGELRRHRARPRRRRR
jgi:hypothetical protein